MSLTNTSSAAKSPDSFAAREFPMLPKDFDFIVSLAKEKTGIQLGPHKKDMIYSRIVRRIRILKFKTFSEYCTFVSSNEKEITPFINAITTNLTAFFREPHHFEFLEKTVLPALIKANASSRRIRIWSAGCSTGEEPYSIAMTLDSLLGKRRDWDVKVLATDLDTSVVSHGKAGIYSLDRVDGLPDKMLKNFSSAEPSVRSSGRQSAACEVVPHIKNYITFKQLNLLEDWPMKGPFDVIFCRNVVIYFDKTIQRTLFDRYADTLTPNGHLFIGHSETLHGVTQRFESLGKTIYRRTR